MAILGGEGLTELVIAKLCEALSHEEGVVPVERAEIIKVLLEQEFTLSGVADPATAVRLGKILQADLYLFTDKVPPVKAVTTDDGKPVAALPEYKHTQVRIEIVETQTGIALVHEALPAPSLEDLDSVVRLVHLAVSKRPIMAQQRWYLGLLEFRNEQPGSSLDGLAEALGMFLLYDLHSFTPFVVLDREHLGRLTEEKELTRVELGLKSSTILLEGGVRRSDEKEKLDLRVILRDLSGTKKGIVEVRVPEDDLGEARKKLLQAVVEKLHGNVSQTLSFDPVKEAGLFADRVRFFWSRQAYDQAVRCSEAALALNPTEENMALAASSWAALAQDVVRTGNQRGVRTGRKARFGDTINEDLPGELKIRALKAQRRALEIRYDLCRQFLEATEKGARQGKVPAFISHPALFPLGIFVQADESEVQQLLLENSKINEEIFNLGIGYLGKNYLRGHSADYWHAWLQMMPSLDGWYSSYPEKELNIARQFLDAFASPPAGSDCDNYANFRFSFLGIWINNYLQQFTIEKGRAARRKVYILLCREMTQHRDPFIRLAGYSGLVGMKEDELNSARALFETLFRDLPPEHPYRAGHFDSEPDIDGLTSFAFSAFRTIAAQDPENLDRVAWQLFGEWIREGNASQLHHWRDSFEWWLMILEGQGRWEEADIIAAATMNSIEKSRVPGQARPMQWVVRRLEGKRQRYADKLGRLVKPDPVWTEYGVRNVPLSLQRDSQHIYFDQDHLYYAYSEDERIKAEVYDLPKGAQGRSLGSLKAKRAGSPFLFNKVLSLSAGNAFLLFPLDDRPARILTDVDGLPTSGIEIQSYAWHQGTLYMGLGMATRRDSAFASYNPEDKSSRVIASTTTLEPRHAFDGGERYRIHAILSDPERNCLWLAVMQDPIPNSKRGLWRYKTQTGEFDKVWPGREIVSLNWHENKILANANGAELVLINPDNSSVERVIANYPVSPDAPRNGIAAPLFGSPNVRQVWPAAFEGDRLFTGGESLYLHRRGKPSTKLLYWPDGQPEKEVEWLGKTSFGILAITRGGDVYLISRLSKGD